MRFFQPFLLAVAAISGVSAQGNSAAIRDLVTGLQGVDSAIANALEVVGGVGSSPLSVAGALPVRLQSHFLSFSHHPRDIGVKGGHPLMLRP